MITPPIFIDESNSQIVFKCLAAAQAYLEPEDMIEPCTFIYDSEGSLLKQRIHLESGTSFRRDVRLELTEDEPTHAGELTEKLKRMLGRYCTEQLLNKLDLFDLVEVSLLFSTDRDRYSWKALLRWFIPPRGWR